MANSIDSLSLQSLISLDLPLNMSGIQIINPQRPACDPNCKSQPTSNRRVIRRCKGNFVRIQNLLAF